MRHSVFLCLVGIAAVAALAGCGSSSVAPPQPGDTVTPVLGGPVNWKAGSNGDLTVRLQAKGTNGSMRALGFNGIETNPVAQIVFFEGSNELNSVQVPLSHRC
jgi:hypothetical protein